MIKDGAVLCMIVNTLAPPPPSNVLNVNEAPLNGHYHILPAGTQMPDGLDIVADGIDVVPNSSHGVGHHTMVSCKR